MAYKAIVCKLQNVRPHEKLHSLNVATVQGHQILTGKESKEGTLGVFYPGDGCLSDAHLKANNLYRKAIRITSPGSTKLREGQIVTRRELSHANKRISETKGQTIAVGTEIDMGGYFEDNGRVRVVKFQGIESDGFWHPIEGYFDWVNDEAAVSSLKDGEEIDSIGGNTIAYKYMTPATRAALASPKQGAAANDRGANLPRHYDTASIERIWNKIPEGSVIYITEKLHGTSGRTGHVQEHKEVTGFRRMWNSLFGGRFLPAFDTLGYDYVSGTRRVTLNTFHKRPRLGRVKRIWNATFGRMSGLTYPVPQVRDEGYYQGTTFRLDIHDNIKVAGLRKGECLYYEIVGYDETGRPIMPNHQVADSKLKKKFGDTMNYTYGCNQIADTFLGVNSHVNSREFLDAIREKMGLNVRLGECQIYVYRITVINEDGDEVELGWDAVKRRCRELGLNHVPELDRFIYDGDADSLKKRCVDLSSTRSTLDARHIMEGVCIRITNDSDDKAWKFKSWHFRDMEGIRKEDDTYVDPEEIA